MKNKTMFVMVMVGLLSCPAGLVLAQESAPTSAEIAAEGGQEAVESAETAEVTLQAGIEEHFSGPRFRYGYTAAGGWLAGAYSGGAGGLNFRLGAQINRILGVYIQPMLLVGVGMRDDVVGVDGALFALAGGALMADATLLDMFYFAGGVELLFGGIGSAAAAGLSGSVELENGPFFSLPFRAGIALGSSQPDRRTGFTIGLDMHIVFAKEVAVMPMISLGWEAF